MTKIKNTKKGMAKKTLSMSLVVAMLATSNVPVWAAEFSDGSDVAVATEAPVVTDTETSEFSDTATTEEAPVVEDTADTPVAQEVDNAVEVNKKDYTVSGLKLGSVGEWGKDVVSVSGNITTKGVSVTDTDTTLEYTWLADGVEADGTNATGLVGKGVDTTKANNYTSINQIKYTPTKADYGKTISLRIYEKNYALSDNAVVFSVTINGGVVKAQDLTDAFAKQGPNIALTFGTEFSQDGTPAPGKADGIYQTKGTVVYNGEENKPTPTNTYAYEYGKGADKQTITEKQISWHYEVAKGGDFTNVTDKNITVYGTIEGTDDPTSPAYGFTGRTATAVYTIQPLEITSQNLKPSLVTASVGYTGAAQKFGKSDVKLEVEVNADTQKRVDITEALKSDFEVSGTDSQVGTNYSVTANTWLSQFADTDAANKICKNFKMPNVSISKKAENTYAIVKRDLRECTGKVTKEYSISTFKGQSAATIDKDDITLTGKDGKSFKLSSMANDVVVQVNKVVFDAANADKKGAVQGAITISYSSDSTNVEGTISLPITLVNRSIGNVWAQFDGDAQGVQLVTSKSNSSIKIVPYTGEAYSLDTKKIKRIEITEFGNEKNKLTSSDYSISYDDNVNAGFVKVTITGKDSFAGSTKEVYFKIKPDEVQKTDFTAKSKVTVNTANNYDASLYKDAMGLKFETDLDNSNPTKKLSLTYDKDYTVKYYYVNTADPTTITSPSAITSHAGTNVPGDYVFAVATPVKDGNYVKANSTDTIIAYSKIEKKSISNVSVTVEKSSYTFTGEEIAANVVVKDGSVTLDKGVDYILKYKNNIDVGTATVMVVPVDSKDNEYDKDTIAEATFKITPAKAEDVTVTLAANGTKAEKVKDNTFKYSGRQVKPLVEKVMLGKVNVTKYFDTTYVTYGDNVNAGKEMGSVTIAPKATTSNFTGTKTQLFNIQGKELNGTFQIYKTNKTLIATAKNQGVDLTTQSNVQFQYDGEAQTFGSEVFTAGTGLKATKDSDYEVKYINNVNAGIGFVAVIAKGNYEANTLNAWDNFDANNWNDGTLKDDARNIKYYVENGVLYQYNAVDREKSVVQRNIVDIVAFRINASYITARNISVANGTYAGGKPVTPEVTVTVNGKTLVEGTDYKLELTSIDGKTTPDKFVDVTTDKPYQVNVVPMGGYSFNDVYGSAGFIWGINKKDLKDCFVKVVKDGEKLDTTVMNGNVVETKENFDVKDNGDGTATVSVVDGGKSYTGSATVTIEDPNATGAVGTAMISNVKVSGNKATVVLSDSVENASGYDYVIATEEDVQNGRVDIVKNQVKTSADFTYVQEGTYYAYCHAWKRGADGKKVFGDWSNIYKFEVTAKTPSQPVITSVKVKGSDVTVTYTKASAAKGYDVVLGTAARKVNGEYRPVEYGTLVKKNLGADTVSVTFKNVEAGTYYAGLHAFNRTSADNTKVFSKWSNVKKVTVK